LITPSVLLVDTLAKTLIDVGADCVVAHDFYGRSLLVGGRPVEDQWVARQLAAGLAMLATERPSVGTYLTKTAISLLPPRVSRVVMTALPEGYLVAHISGLEGYLTDALARRLATAIEAWLAQHRNPYGIPLMWGSMSRFYRGL
jgi:hypothetical protein